MTNKQIAFTLAILTAALLHEDVEARASRRRRQQSDVAAAQTAQKQETPYKRFFREPRIVEVQHSVTEQKPVIDQYGRLSHVNETTSYSVAPEQESRVNETLQALSVIKNQGETKA